MESFATVDELASMWRALTTAERERAETLLPAISDRLRVEAAKVGKDLDTMVAESGELETVAKSVCCDIAARTLMTSTSSEPMTQMSQSVGGYAVSGTFLSPGGGIFIKNTELAALGLKRQRFGVIEL